MQAASQRFRAAIPYSHIVTGRAQLINPNGSVIETDYGPDLPVTGGSVRASSTQLVRRTVNLELTDPLGTLAPRSRVDDVLSTYGSEFRVWRGIRFDDGTAEEKCLGTFILDEVDPNSPGKLVLNGTDRSSRAMVKYKIPLPILNATPGDEAIILAIHNCYPGASFRPSSTLWTIPLQLFEVGTEGLVAAHDMATAIGLTVFADVDGYFVIRPAPGLDPTISWTFDHEITSGPSASTIMETTRALKAGGVNGFIVLGTQGRGDSTPGAASSVRGEAWDEDETSPTWRHGVYGERPEVVESDKVTNKTQADDMAKGLLQAKLGAADEVSFEAIANSALLEGDVVKINRPDLKLNGTFIISDIDMPLFGAKMSVTAQRWIKSEQGHG